MNIYDIICNDESISPTLKFNLQKQKIYERIEAKREKEMLINEITNEVLKRLSVKAETADAIMEIESLQKAIDNLKGGK